MNDPDTLETQIGDEPPEPALPEVNELPPGVDAAAKRSSGRSVSRRNAVLVASVLGLCLALGVYLKMRNSGKVAEGEPAQVKIDRAVARDFPDAPTPGAPELNQQAVQLEKETEKERLQLAKQNNDTYFPRFGEMDNDAARSSADRAASLPMNGPANGTSEAQQAAETKAVDVMLGELNRLDRRYDAVRVRSYPVEEHQVANSTAKSSSTVAAGTKPDIEQGSILVASVKTEVNSYQPGTPVVADISAGPYRDMRLMGTFQESGGKLIVVFNTCRYKSVSTPCQAYAVDKDTNAAAVRSDIDNHYVERFGLIFAAGFVGSLKESATDVTNVSLSPLGGASYQVPQIKNSFKYGIGAGGQALTEVLTANANKIARSEVFLHQNEMIGVLFMESVSLSGTIN